MAGKSPFQGLSDAELLDRSAVIVDTRPLTRQAFDALMHQPPVAVGAIGFLWFCAMAFPSMTVPLLGVCLGIMMARVVYTRWYERLPLRQPWFLRRRDPGDRDPAGKHPLSRGVIYVGNERKTNKEIWISKQDALNHIMIFGATGAGKSEFLISIVFNFIAAGSGTFYIDPKAALQLAIQFHVMARMCLRDDDFRLLNFMTAGDPSGIKRPIRWPEKRTNCVNQLAFLNADDAVQMIEALMPKTEGQNSVFSQNAQTLLRGLMPPLVYLRDRKEIEMSMETVRTYLARDKVTELSQRKDIPDHLIAGLRSFLSSMGYQPGMPLEKQGKVFNEQYSYAANYFNIAFASLVDTYRAIYETPAGDTDLFDMIRNRRIVLALLPSLQKSAQECETLGKINLSALRAAIAVGLGSMPEGTIDDTLYSLPLAADFPFLSGTDEYAAIPVPGYAEVATQGRGLGIAAAVGTQDYPGLMKADEKGGGQIIANTRLRAFGRVADAQTFQLLKELAGEWHVAQQSQLTREQMGPAKGHGGHRMNFQATPSVGISAASRVAPIDLQCQIEGEYHLLMDGVLVRAKVFYSSIPLEANYAMELARMVTPHHPDKRKLSMKYGAIRELANRLDEIARDPETFRDLTQAIHKTRAPAGITEALLPPLRQPLTDEATLSAMDRTIAAFVRYARALESPSKAPPGGDRPENHPIQDAPDIGAESTRDKGPVTESETPVPVVAHTPVAETAGGHAQPAPAMVVEVADPEVDREAGLSGPGGVASLAESVSRVTAYLFGEEEDTALRADLAQIEQAVGQTPEAAAKASQQVLDAVHADLSYPAAVTPAPEMGRDVVMDSISVLMARARKAGVRDSGNA